MASTQQVVKHMIKPLHAEGLIVWLNDAPEYGEMQRSWRGAKFHEKVYCVFFNTVFGEKYRRRGK